MLPSIKTISIKIISRIQEFYLAKTILMFSPVCPSIQPTLTDLSAKLD